MLFTASLGLSLAYCTQLIFRMLFITALGLSLAHLLINHFCMPLIQPFYHGLSTAH